MNVREEGVVFECDGASLLGVASHPAMPASNGLLIVVGGPQYRAGSHRQFVDLARRAAGRGIAALRFDYRGMGDAEGEPVGFEGAGRDIGAAIDALCERCPSVRRVYLWGLCDAASAVLLYLDGRRDPRVVGACLLNPWVRTSAGLARAQVKFYYARRIADPDFWRKLLRGGVGWRALREFLAKIGQARSLSSAGGGELPFQGRMARALSAFAGRTLLVLSGRDLTAREFLEYVNADQAWATVLASAALTRVDVPQADHTFSSAEWRATVTEATLSWIEADS